MTLVLDLTATALAFLLFGVCLLPVGWLAVRALAVPGCRAAWALLLGVALVPAGVYGLARPFGMAAGWAGLAVLAAAALLGMLRAGERHALAEALAPLRDRRLLWGGALWLGLGWLAIVDLPVGDRLSLSGVLIDYAKHVSVTDAISRTGIPPVNPNFYPGEPVPLFYYYFWFLLCSLADQLGGGLVTAKHAVFAGTLWAGLLLVATLRLFAERLPDALAPARRTALAAALLLVTGLDLLPFLAIHLHAAVAGGVPGPLPDLEWWNEQVTAWISAVLWVPHHVGALTVCLTAFLLLNTEPPRVGRVAAAGLAFASALGMSIWVTLTAAVIAATWCAVLLARLEGRVLGGWLAAGLLAALLALPYILDLAASRQGGEVPVGWGVRAFFPLTRAEQYFGTDIPCGEACRLAVLPLNYLLEFGFFALAGVVYWRRRGWPGTRDERFLLTAAVVALVFCSVVKSTVALNDLGWRGLMVTQFALLLWAAPLAAELASRPWLKAAALLGVAASFIQVVQLRAQPATLRDAELRRTYEWVAAHTPRDAVLQHDPAVPLEALHAVYGNRQAAFSDWQYAALYGVDKEAAWRLRGALAPLFAAEPPPLAEVVALAERFAITHLIAKAEDPAWQARGGWVWAAEPLFATPSSRVLAVADLPRR